MSFYKELFSFSISLKDKIGDFLEKGDFLNEPQSTQCHIVTKQMIEFFADKISQLDPKLKFTEEIIISSTLEIIEMLKSKTINDTDNLVFWIITNLLKNHSSKKEKDNKKEKEKRIQHKSNQKDSIKFAF